MIILSEFRFYDGSYHNNMSRQFYKVQSESALLRLPNEIIFEIISKLLLSNILAFASASKNTNVLVYQEILKISLSQYIQLQVSYNSGPSVIQNNLTLLKLKYRPLHPDYSAYRVLEKLPSKERIKTAVSSQNYRNIFLRYPSFYQMYLPDVEIRKFYPIHSALEYPDFRVLRNQWWRYNPLKLFKHFAWQVITSDYLLPKHYKSAIKIITKSPYHYHNIERYIEENLVLRSLYTNRYNYYKECRKYLIAYAFIKMLLDTVEQTKDRQQLCDYIKDQAEKKAITQSFLELSRVY